MLHAAVYKGQARTRLVRQPDLQLPTYVRIQIMLVLLHKPGTMSGQSARSLKVQIITAPMVIHQTLREHVPACTKVTMHAEVPRLPYRS